MTRRSRTRGPTAPRRSSATEVVALFAACVRMALAHGPYNPSTRFTWSRTATQERVAGYGPVGVRRVRLSAPGHLMRRFSTMRSSLQTGRVCAFSCRLVSAKSRCEGAAQRACSHPRGNTRRAGGYPQFLPRTQQARPRRYIPVSGSARRRARRLSQRWLGEHAGRSNVHLRRGAALGS